MKLPHRRRFLHLAAGAAVLPALSHNARAETYPTRTVRWIVPNAAGDMPDILARLVGHWLSERLGQPVVFDNRPGAGTNIGIEAAVHAVPDGYSLVLLGPPAAINATLYDKLNFNVIRDIAPVASIARAPNVLEVSLTVPVKTVREFIAYAKANPGKLNMASTGVGTSPHVSGELFKMMTGVNLVHVPYRGAAAAITDLLSGQVQVFFDNLPSSIEHIKAGKLRALAVTTTTRSDALPDLPTVGEFVPGYEATPSWGVGVPKKTPAEIIEKLNKEINGALADPKMTARITDLGATVLAGTPAEFGKLIADETEKWGQGGEVRGYQGGLIPQR
jgi:tripartite-type tricarboxylate transporter receptor subunit TctC